MNNYQMNEQLDNLSIQSKNKHVSSHDDVEMINTYAND